MYKGKELEKIRIPVTGDFITLGKMLSIDSSAARMRYRRGKQDAVDAMNKIFESREKLISEYSSGHESLTENN